MQRIGTFTRPAVISILIVIGCLACSRTAQAERYVCPMKCGNVVYEKAGTCSTCGMALVVQTAEVTQRRSRGAKVYVCPPCGNSCDSTEHQQPGACPSCGMTLVKKGSAADRPVIPQSEERKRVAILIFQGVQIIDYTAPWEVFGQAGFEVFTVAETKQSVTTSMGMSVNPQYTLDDHPRPEVVVLPGGEVPSHHSKPQIIAWIQEQARQAEVVLSVCNGAYFLAKAGLLDGLEATTFASLIPGLQAAAPKARVVSDKRYVDNGKIVTSAGLSSGIDAALHVVEKLRGKGRAQMVAINLEYNWDREGKFVRAALADKHMRAIIDFMRSFSPKVLNHEGGTDYWTTQWSMQSDSSANAMLSRLNDHLAASANWSCVSENQTNGALKSTWKFSDNERKNWKGTASVQSVAEEQGKLWVSVEIGREGKSASAQRP